MNYKDEWMGELQTKNLKLLFRVKEHVFHSISKYQTIDVIESFGHGKVLFLDKIVQLTERDEFIYHEMIVHVPVNYMKIPENVLIIGGGDGGTARECLKYNISSVLLVEIDKMVIEVSKRFFPTLSQAFNDERVQIRVDDGIEFVKTTNKKFDLIIIDSTDPIGPAKALFSLEFYKNIKRILTNEGIIVTQSGDAFYDTPVLINTYKNLNKVFNYVFTYLAHVPTYPSGMWSFTLASDRKLDNIYNRTVNTRYYSYTLHKNLVLPKFLEELLKKS